MYFSSIYTWLVLWAYPPAYSDHLLSSDREEINIGIAGGVDQKEKAKCLLPCCHKSSHYGDKGILCLLKKKKKKREEMTEEIGGE